MTLKAFTMPKWGIEMREGTVAEWLIQEGDTFAKGDLIVLIETDKITNEVEAEFPGTLARVVSPAGGLQPVGALLGVFADGGEDAAAIEAFIERFTAADTSTAAGGAGSTVKSSKPEPKQAERSAVAMTDDSAKFSPQARQLVEMTGVDIAGLSGSGRHGRVTYQDVMQATRPATEIVPRGTFPVDHVQVETVFASPLARRIAAQHGIDLAGLTGSGPRGRVSKADLLALVTIPTVADRKAPSAITNEYEVEPMSGVRKTIARRLTDAKQTIPHFYLRMEIGVDALLALRPTASLILGAKISINDLLIRAAAIALVEVPDVNIQVHGDDILRFNHADIAVAVASERGLVTPIVRSADQLRVDAIAITVKSLVAKAQAGRLGMADLEGGTFTISNLGMFGVDQFDAIINPPQGAILAVGAVREVFARSPDGDGRFEQRMTLTLSCDHRAIDGATGARFLAALKRLIEQPETLFS